MWTGGESLSYFTGRTVSKWKKKLLRQRVKIRVHLCLNLDKRSVFQISTCPCIESFWNRNNDKIEKDDDCNKLKVYMQLNMLDCISNSLTSGESMQFSGKIGEIVCCPLWGWRPILCEILNPPLLTILAPTYYIFFISFSVVPVSAKQGVPQSLVPGPIQGEGGTPVRS